MPQPRVFRSASLALATYFSASLIASTGAPQDSAKAAGPDVVSVAVRVTDKDGKPVSDLAASDFVVNLDSQTRAATVSSLSVTAKAAPRTLLFVFDDLSAEPAQVKTLVASAQQVLGSLDPADLVGVATTSGLGPSLAPTRDRAAVTAALASADLAGRLGPRTLKPFVGTSEAFDMVRTGGNKDIGTKVIERECGSGSSSGGGGGGGSRSRPAGNGGGAKPDDTCTATVVASARTIATAGVQRTARELSAYTRLLSSLPSASEPRALVVFSGGVALPLGTSDAIDILARRAADVDAAVYGVVAIDESDLTTEASAERSKARREENTYLTTGLQSLATAAGGEAIRISSATDHALDHLVGGSGVVYRLAVEPPSAAQRRHYVAAKVTVSRAGLTARTSAEAVRAAVAETPVMAADALKQRVEQGGTGFGVPIALTTSRRRDTSAAKVQLVASIDVPATVPGPVTAMFALISSSGSVVQSGKKELPATAGDDFRLALPLPADPGDYRFRVAVADGQGHIGSLDDVLSVKLPKAGAIAMSDLVTTSAAADAPPHLLAFETLPARAQTLHVSLELYPETTDASAVKVQLSVASASGGAPLVNGEVPPAARDGRLLVSAALPVAGLKPDRYVITATVMDGGKPAGTATAYVTKIQ